MVAKLKQNSSKTPEPGTADVSGGRTNGTHKKRELLNALERSLGIITIACQAVGIGRSTFYRWYRDDGDFRSECDDISNVAIDFVESRLLENIAKGDVTSIIFYLKTKGKHRGYVERRETYAPLNSQKRFTLIIKGDPN